MKFKYLLLALCLTGWLLLNGHSPTAHAATFIVTNTDDSGTGSLRDAVTSANGNAEADTINFDANLAGQTITLTSGEIVINDDLSIDASALATPVTISGNNSNRIFRIESAAGVTIQYLRLVNGFADDENGGAILIANDFTAATADVTVTHTIFENNVASFAGGAIQQNETGTLWVESSTFLSNESTNSFGGAIQNNNGTVRVTNSTFVGNQANAGGAVYNAGFMTTHITNSTFLNNGANGSGSAVYSSTDGILHITNNIMYGTLTVPYNAPICNSLGTLPTNSQNWIDYDDNCNPALSGNPYLMPLDDNGGTTPTVALLPFSPAANQGTSNCPATDQRGQARGATCDLGAFEIQTNDHQIDQCHTGLVQGETYAFGATGILVTVDTLGSLTQLCARLTPSNHPNATAGIQTNRYWTVTPTAGASNWSLTMSAPATIPLDSGDKLCRYTGSGQVWDCGEPEDHTSIADGWLTRSSIEQLSPWAVGNDVGPTAVTLQSFTTVSQQGGLAALVATLLTALSGIWLWTRRPKKAEHKA